MEADGKLGSPRYLGIDIGSTTFKAVLLDGEGKVLRTVYKRTQPV